MLECKNCLGRYEVGTIVNFCSQTCADETRCEQHAILCEKAVHGETEAELELQWFLGFPEEDTAVHVTPEPTEVTEADIVDEVVLWRGEPVVWCNKACCSDTPDK